MSTAKLKSIVMAAAFAAAGLGAASAAQATAVSVTTAVGNGADTYLINDGGTSSTVFAGAGQGGAAEMELRNYAGIRMRMPFLRFDLSAYQGDTISNASLSVTVAGANRDRVVAVYGFTNYAYTNPTASQSFNWSEANTIYPGWAKAGGVASSGSYAPGFTAAAAGTYSPALSNGNNPVNGVSSAASANWAVLGGFETGSGGAPTAAGSTLTSSAVVVPTVGVPGVNAPSSAFANFLNGALANPADKGLVTLALMTTAPDSNADFYFYTKENTSSAAFPTLTFTATPAVPEPATLGLFAVAGLGLLLLRRRAV